MWKWTMKVLEESMNYYVYLKEFGSLCKQDAKLSSLKKKMDQFNYIKVQIFTK